jgi:glutamine phosphoribosylpyrophosphate amidotransferase
MCGVVGASLQNVDVDVFNYVKAAMLQSMIRGRHATGISWIASKSGQVKTVKEPIPADEFLEFQWPSMDDMVDDRGNLNMIGHCRYSTSDIEYNQPLGNLLCSIVHNGVITQELYENWERIYGVKTETKNDSELLLNTETPLIDYPDASIAACQLTISGLTGYRNGKRPLYYTVLPDHGIIFTSTADISLRALGGDNEPVMLSPDAYYEWKGNKLKISEGKGPPGGRKDYQDVIR